MKLQAAVRGYLVRNNARLRLGCIIILQSTMRRCIAQIHYRQIKTSNMVLASSTIGLRETNASKRIQAAWRDRYETRKIAGLTIERFFLMVKAAVDLEILRQEQQDQLERELALKTRPAEAVDVVTLADDVSEMTSPSVFHRSARHSPRHRYAPREEDMCLEEAWEDTELHEVRKQRQMEEEYLQRYGLSEKDPRRRRPRHESSRESPQRRRSSSTPRARRSPHRSREYASPQRRAPSSRDRRHVPPSGSPGDRAWSEEDRYHKETRNPSARTYRSPKHYQETQSMRSEFSPHSSQAVPSLSMKTSRRPSSRDSPHSLDGYEYGEYNKKQHGRPQRRHADYEHDEPTPRRHGSRERPSQQQKNGVSRYTFKKMG